MDDDFYNEIEEMLDLEKFHRIPEFEGLSPEEMDNLLYRTFEENSPLELGELSESDYLKIPILNQIKYLLKLIEKEGELKLTASGYLPPKVVKEIYNQKFIKEEAIESGVFTLRKEKDSDTINLTRIITELCGLIKKRYNKLSLTNQGRRGLISNQRLLRNIFITFTTKFNWSYYDGYGDEKIGQLGFGFSLYLLGKYGSVKREDSFYSKKYYLAFPMVREQARNQEWPVIGDSLLSCYSLRTFDRFLKYFGLIKLEHGKKSHSEKIIRKTALFDKFIKIKKFY